MNELINVLKELEKYLSKHSAISTIFRNATTEEINDFLNTASSEVYKDAWNSLTSNINTLSSVSFEKDENKPTKNILTHINTLSSIINKDNRFPDEIFNNDENKVLLINVASMINLFGVNCRVEHKISKFIDNDLNLI